MKACARENAMLKLGTRVEYANQTGRIVGRTIELQPKYDIMLANGTIRSYVREGDLVILPQSAAESDRQSDRRRSGTLGTSGEPATSMRQAQATEQSTEEDWNADSDRGG
jgi:hypothetical protein